VRFPSELRCSVSTLNLKGHFLRVAFLTFYEFALLGVASKKCNFVLPELEAPCMMHGAQLSPLCI